MHTSGFCHADLKNSNAMVAHTEGTVTVRLIDLACSQQQKPCRHQSCFADASCYKVAKENVDICAEAAHPMSRQCTTDSVLVPAGDGLVLTTDCKRRPGGHFICNQICTAAARPSSADTHCFRIFLH